MTHSGLATPCLQRRLIALKGSFVNLSAFGSFHAVNCSHFLICNNLQKYCSFHSLFLCRKLLEKTYLTSHFELCNLFFEDYLSKHLECLHKESNLFTCQYACVVAGFVMSPMQSDSLASVLQTRIWALGSASRKGLISLDHSETAFCGGALKGRSVHAFAPGAPIKAAHSSNQMPRKDTCPEIANTLYIAGSDVICPSHRSKNRFQNGVHGRKVSFRPRQYILGFCAILGSRPFWLALRAISSFLLRSWVMLQW